LALLALLPVLYKKMKGKRIPVGGDQ